MHKIKEMLKRSPLLLRIVAAIYRILHFNNAWRARLHNEICLDGVFLKNTKFVIRGGNTIRIGARARLYNCRITIIGSGNELIIGGGSTIISHTSFWMQHGQNKIIIGRDFTMEGGGIAAIEGTEVRIGDDCMFSGGIDIRTGDSHSILNAETGERTNPSQSIVIGNHVWLTAFSRIMKGAVVPNNSIVGNSSLVTSRFTQSNAVYAGIPARFIKGSVNWDRYLK